MGNTLGIDQSYTSCGFCVCDESRQMLTFGIHRSSKDKDVYDRAIETADHIVKVINDYAIKHVNIEGLAFGIRGDATRDLAGLLFTIITTMRRMVPHVTVDIIAPTSLKKFATGTGKSDKSVMISSVPEQVVEQFTEAKYKKTTGLADLCDAYWLAMYQH